jgi:hypothetical protein
MKKPKNLGFEPVHPKNVLLASVVHGIFFLYFVLILLGVGNPHRYLQFGIVAIKTSNFLPEFGTGRYTNFLKI